MNPTSAFWYAVGIIAAFVFIQLFARQLEMLVQVFGNSIVGGVALWLLNLVGGSLGFHLALNPVTAGITRLTWHTRTDQSCSDAKNSGLILPTEQGKIQQMRLHWHRQGRVGSSVEPQRAGER